MRRHEEYVRPRGIIRCCADLYRQNRTPFIGSADGIDVDKGIRSRPCVQRRANSVGGIVERMEGAEGVLHRARGHAGERGRRDSKSPRGQPRFRLGRDDNQRAQRSVD